MDETSVWAGIDYGEETTAICAVDAHGRVLLRRTSTSEPETIADVLAIFLPARLRGAVIEGAATGHFIGQLQALGLPLVVVDAKKASKILSFYRNKTDENDARGLCEIGRLGAAPSMRVHLRSKECRAIRDQLVMRDRMVREAASLRLSLRSLLRRHGSAVRALPKGIALRANVENELLALGSSGNSPLAELALPIVEVHESIMRYVKAISRRLERDAQNLPITRAFLEIPGIGYLAALSFYSVIEDPHRFRRSEDVGAYLGLVPRIKQSGNTTRRSGITKGGDRLTRRNLVLSGGVLINRAKKDCALKEWAQELARRSGHYSARVAAARKLSVIMLSMWKRERSFEPYPSATRG